MATVQTLLDQLSAVLGKGFMDGVAGMTTRAQIARLAAAIETGNISAVMKAAGMRRGAFPTMTEAVRKAYHEGGMFTMDGTVPAQFGQPFDISNPRAEMWLRNRSSKLIKKITDDQRKAIQLVLKDGLKRGANPLSVGLDITGRMANVPGIGRARVGGIIGLNQPQTRAVLNARKDLNNLDRNYFTRAQRAKRYDPIVKKAIKAGKPLPASTVSKLTGKYSDNLKRLRGQTIGRTEALRALNEASDEAMRQVVDEGLAPKKAITRIWHHSYSKHERPGHLAMGKELQEAGMDETFTNPYTKAELKYPGDGPAAETINCRCWVEHRVDFVTLEGGKKKPITTGLKPVKPKVVKPKVVKPKGLTAAQIEAARKAEHSAKVKAGIAKAKAKKAQQKVTLNPDGGKPTRNQWMAKGRKLGAFQTPRLSKVVLNISDPKQLHLTKKGAHYNSTRKGINMQNKHTGQMLNFDEVHGYKARNTQVHEWGHYLDDQLARILESVGSATVKFKHPLGKALKKLCGATADTWYPYLSEMSKVVKMTARDGVKLQQLGKKVHKRVHGKNAKNYDVYDHRMIDESWSRRKMQLADKYTSNEATEIAIKAGRKEMKVLATKDNLVARVYEHLRERDVWINPWDELLFMDAAKAGDLSFLLRDQGRYLQKLLPETSDGIFGSFTDLLGASTAEQGIGGHSYMGWSGHGKKYYEGYWGKQNQGTESFAQLTAMEIERARSPIWDQVVKAFAPEFTRWYDELLDLLNTL